MQEIAVGRAEIFVRARINYGHLHWYARDYRKFKMSKLAETDQVFLPLRSSYANAPKVQKVVDEMDPKYDPVLTPSKWLH